MVCQAHAETKVSLTNGHNFKISRKGIDVKTSNGTEKAIFSL